MWDTSQDERSIRFHHPSRCVCLRSLRGNWLSRCSYPRRRLQGSVRSWVSPKRIHPPLTRKSPIHLACANTSARLMAAQWRTMGIATMADRGASTLTHDAHCSTHFVSCPKAREPLLSSLRGAGTLSVSSAKIARIAVPVQDRQKLSETPQGMCLQTSLTS